MKRSFIALSLSLYSICCFAGEIDAIMCVKSLKNTNWQPYVQYVRTSEKRPDIAFSTQKGQDFYFTKSNIEINNTQVVLTGSKQESSLVLTLKLTDENDDSGNDNIMADGTLVIDGKKKGPIFQCAISM